MIRKLNLHLASLSLLLLVVFPLAAILQHSIYHQQQWQFTHLAAQLFQLYPFQILANSLLLAALVTLFATALAAPLAWIMARTPLARHRRLEVLILLPFMTPPFIDSMGWIVFMQPRGYLEQLAPQLAFLQQGFFSLAGMVLIMGLSLFPFLYLMLKNNLLQISASLEDAAQVAGAGRWRIISRVVAPLMLSSYAMGALLIFVKTISEFGTPATLGKQIGFYVLTTEIHRYTSTWPIDFSRAAMLSSILLFTSMALWAGQVYLSERFRQPLVGGRSAAAKSYQLKPWQTVLAYGYVVLLLVLAIGVPYFSIVLTACLDLAGLGLAWDNFTLRHFAEVFSRDGEALQALFTSLKLSFYSACLCALLGLWYAMVVVRQPGWVSRCIDFASLMSNTIPGIVVVFGLILFWNSPHNPLPVYNSEWMLILTYVALFIPYTVQYVKAALQQLATSLGQAAKICGASEWYGFRRITLPLLVPALMSGWMMSFVIGQRELVGSLMVKPPGIETSATFIFHEFDQGNASLAMAMALIVVGTTSLVLMAMKVWESRNNS
ncbi:ABC transporter permease [Aliagarivorans taiwanensis]|uniref:ABC transporter permease n=1 Tax=Aliagarivorans taiwanensis TaxID=561966 RepID=UPI00040A5500|nr:iron ABC transporter permease [Aliagarivorans taiwanensis]